MVLEPDQNFDPVFFGESLEHSFLMLENPPIEIVRDADIERAVASARQNIDVEADFRASPLLIPTASPPLIPAQAGIEACWPSLTKVGTCEWPFTNLSVVDKPGQLHRDMGRNDTILWSPGLSLRDRVV